MANSQVREWHLRWTRYLSSATAPILGDLPGPPCLAQCSYLGSLTSRRRMKSFASSLVLLNYDFDEEYFSNTSSLVLLKYSSSKS